MTPLYIETPVHSIAAMNARLNKTIYLKMECYQPCGSFKARGIGRLCQDAVESGRTHLISSSGGNAGYAAAYAGRILNAKVTVVVPETTQATARERIASEGAEVIVRGSVWDEANAYAQELVEKYNGAYIHPFDLPLVWEGHASLVDEAVKQCPKPDAVVLSVGGGGLLVGMVQGMHRNGWQDVPVIAVETEGAASFAASVRAGELVSLPKIDSIATTLGALKVTPKALEWANQHPIIAQQVTDYDAVQACLKFADDMRVIVEPACGAALSLLYDNAHMLEGYESVFVVVCGGAGATMQDLTRWSDQVMPVATT